MILPQGKVKHLMYRAGFGTGVLVEPWDMKSMWKGAGDSTPLSTAEKAVLPEGPDQKEKVKQMFEKSKQDLMKVNVAWVLQMSRQPGLRERMTLFWHNHFACRTLFPWFAQDLNNQIRSLALESFSDLLMAVSKHPAMLQFLNNQQNRKDHPNENFAREVMELFTMGRGNYSEEDIKEAARAFTGWGFNAQGAFQFRPRQHDESVKSFRGKQGNFKGEDIIHMILEDPKTALHITRKLSATLVSDDSVDENIIKDWADTFYRSGYRIDKLVERILKSEEFEKPTNTGTRIKSPIELLVGILLHTNGKFEDEKSIVFLQRALGQILFFPPNVSGWPNGKAWIDSSSLTLRLTLPRLLFSGDETDFRIREDGDVNGLQSDTPGRRRLHCKVDWASLTQHLTKSNKSDTLGAIEEFLLARPLIPSNKKWLEQVTNRSSSDQDLVKNAFVSLMSLPEYQMC